MKTKDVEEKNESMDSINIKILDSILEDDDEQFFQIISQMNNDDLNFNKRFKLTKYKLPQILSGQPTYASLCSFFGAEKCLNSLITLLPDGIKSNFFNQKDDRGRQPIHFACVSGNLNILRLYYQEDFDFNARDIYGQTPSHYAAMSSTNDAIKYLCMKGIDILEQVDYGNMTPLHTACMYGNMEVVQFLCEKVATDCNQILESKNIKIQKYYNRYWRNMTPLHLACKSGCVDVVNYILSKKELAKIQIKSLNYYSQRPIDCAIQNGSFECVKSLVQIGKTDLFVHGRKHVPLVDAAASGYVDIVSYILKQKKVEINVVDSKKVNALDAAVINDHIEVVKILIENGITNKYNDNEIGSIFLKSCQIKNIKMVKFLDEKLKVPYTQMGSLFMKQAILIEDEELISFLLEKGCSFESSNFHNFNSRWTPFMSFLKDKGFDFTTCYSKGNIPLIVKSINRGGLQSVKKLIDEGIELNSEIISDYNCILTACKLVKFDLFIFLLSYKPVIKNIDICLLELIEQHINIKSRAKPSKKLMDDCIKIAEILFNQFDYKLKDEAIYKAIYSCSIEFLELFERFSMDCKKLVLEYSKMTSSKFLPIFTFLENNGCSFDKVSGEKSWHYNYCHFGQGNRQKKCYKNSPVRRNLLQYSNYNYDVNTLLFLIKYAKREDLIYSTFYTNNFNNVIDVLVSFNCFDSISSVFKKLNRILYPKSKSKVEFVTLVNTSGNNELIEMMDLLEEEDVDEDEEQSNDNSYYNYYYDYQRNYQGPTLTRLMKRFNDV